MSSNTKQSTNNSQQQKHKFKRLNSLKKNTLQIEDIQDKPYQQIESPSKLYNNSPDSESPEQRQRQSRITKRKSKHIKLQPFGGVDPTKINLPQNKSEQVQEENPQKQQKKQKRQKAFFNFDSDDDQQQNIQSVSITITNKSQNIPKKSQQPQIKKQPQIPHNHYLNQTNQLQVSHNAILNRSQLQQQQQNQNQNQNGIQVDNTQHTLIQRQILVSGAIAFRLRRSKQWLNRFWPQFNMHYFENNQYFLSAKLTGNNASTTFIMCKNKQDFVENNTTYAGKVKANFIGNIINVYGPGYNPSDHVNKNMPIREILATVEFQTNFFGSTRPRDFKAYVLQPGVSYYKDLIGPVIGQDQIPLNQLYENQSNQDKILVMANRKPTFNQTIKGYMLNFGGRVKKASVKNFILEDVDQPENARVLFGKITDDQFRLDVTKPVTPIVGLGIALAQFGGKIGCQ